MITTLSEILAAWQVRQEDTIYAASHAKVLDFPIVAGDYFTVEGEKEKGRILYKNMVVAMDFEQMARRLPLFAKMRFPQKNQMPFFVAGLESLETALQYDKQVAVEGGPCLFGVDEVEVQITEKGGKCRYFDYSLGKPNDREDEREDERENLADYAIRNGKSIVRIEFDDRKQSVTPQEYDSIAYLFEAARILPHARVVLPLPDMSYLKFLDAILVNVSEPVKKKAREDFSQIAYRISDLYGKLTEELAKSYPGIPYDIVREQDRELCEKYYEKRAPFIERNRVLRSLTAIPEKLESIKDYISMPALPYYLHGIKDILEIDSIDETDSYRKCRKAHKGTINLSCMLYPERLSQDGKNTIFTAKRQYKEYLHMEQEG